MAIPNEFVPQVLAYCREPEPDDWAMLALNQAWDSAAAYLEGAGVARPQPDSPRATLWLSVMLAMVLDEYDQRGAQFESGKLQDNAGFRRKLNQLKLSDTVSSSDTSREG